MRYGHGGRVLDNQRRSRSTDWRLSARRPRGARPSFHSAEVVVRQAPKTKASPTMCRRSCSATRATEMAGTARARSPADFLSISRCASSRSTGSITEAKRRRSAERKSRLAAATIAPPNLHLVRTSSCGQATSVSRQERLPVAQLPAQLHSSAPARCVAMSATHGAATPSQPLANTLAGQRLNSCTSMSPLS